MTTGIRLPAEVLTVILKEVDDVRDLCHVRMACRALCAAATPLTFRILSVTRTRRSAQYLGQLLDNPDIAVHVREVSYRDVGADRRGKELRRGLAPSANWLLLFSRIYQLLRLETINLTFCPTLGHQVDTDSENRLSLQSSLLGALATSFSIRAPSKLTSLCLHDLLMSDLSPFESPPFQAVLASTLRCLQRSVLYDIAPDDARWCNIWSVFFPRTIAAPTQHSLTEFSLHSDMPIGSSSELSFAELFLPHLCTLSLANFVLEPSVGITATRPALYKRVL